MLYVFCGDRYAAREHARAFVSACREKRENAEYIHLSSHMSYSLEELLQGQGLFENKYIVFCDELLGGDFSKHLESKPELYNAAPHMFILFEPDLQGALEKKFITIGAVIKRSAEKQDRRDSKALFSFTDILLRGDVNKSFVALHKLLYQGEPPTSVLNIILWQLRVLALANCSDSADGVGLKPFVYTKAKAALKNFQEPSVTFFRAEEAVRRGRLQGFSEEEIVEDVVLSLS